MKTTMFQKIRVLRASLAGALLAGIGCTVALGWSGCMLGGGGTEGNRCVPQLSHNECNSGLNCVTGSYTDPNGVTFTCGESYCCPASGTSVSGNCNGGAMAPNANGTLQCPGYCTDPTTMMMTMVLPLSTTPNYDGGTMCPTSSSSSSSSSTSDAGDAGSSPTPDGGDAGRD